MRADVAKLLVLDEPFKGISSTEASRMLAALGAQARATGQVCGGVVSYLIPGVAMYVCVCVWRCARQSLIFLRGDVSVETICMVTPAEMCTTFGYQRDAQNELLWYTRSGVATNAKGGLKWLICFYSIWYILYSSIINHLSKAAWAA